MWFACNQLICDNEKVEAIQINILGKLEGHDICLNAKAQV